VGAGMVLSGHAQAYRRFRVVRLVWYVSLERAAREADRGMWGRCE
jgi:endonuclease YncB( thermonuclease family)